MSDADSESRVAEKSQGNSKQTHLTCIHGKRKASCIDCSPHLFCVHNRQRSQCKQRLRWGVCLRAQAAALLLQRLRWGVCLRAQRGSAPSATIAMECLSVCTRGRAALLLQPGYLRFRFYYPLDAVRFYPQVPVSIIFMEINLLMRILYVHVQRIPK